MKYCAEEKYEIIGLVEASSLSVRKTLKQIAVSKSSFYEWYPRYLEDGIEGLRDRTNGRISSGTESPMKSGSALSSMRWSTPDYRVER